ncbi:MAG: HD domain-containing protein [Hyphomicrobiales bacterium]
MSNSLEEQAKAIILKHCKIEDKSFRILWEHSVVIKDACIRILEANPDITVNKEELILGALLHDIGIIYTKAPDLGCNGKQNYIEHGYLGHDILMKEGLSNIAPFCERHTGTGISKQDIINNELPLPQRDLMPISEEEKILCYADKFFSKSDKDLSTPKPLEKVIKSMSKYGKNNRNRFMEMINRYGTKAIYNNK